LLDRLSHAPLNEDEIGDRDFMVRINISGN
jgi:hypothetical protein